MTDLNARSYCAIGDDCGRLQPFRLAAVAITATDSDYWYAVLSSTDVTDWSFEREATLHLEELHVEVFAHTSLGEPTLTIEGKGDPPGPLKVFSTPVDEY